MKKILIADSSKASLVMTSEVFKDHYPGIQVLVAKNSEEALNLAKSTENIDAYIIDYDLPDLNGAKTAALLKKISKTPILITAFDREEVAQNIETLLKKYDDCKSWLKKPVNPEVVIAVAQRYCDGKIRAQKRIVCQLPVIAKMEIMTIIAETKTLKESKEEKKSHLKTVTNSKKQVVKKVAKEIEKEIRTQPELLYFHGIIEDCSLSGVKLKPSKHTQNNLSEWTTLLKNMGQITSGHPVTLKMPTFFDIEVGKNCELVKVVKSEKIVSKTTSTKPKTINTKSKAKVENKIQELNGTVVWTNSDSGEWFMGVEFEDQNLSKKLFEAIVTLQSRHLKSSQNQTIMKTNRNAS